MIVLGDADKLQETESVCQESYRQTYTCDRKIGNQTRYNKHNAHANTYRSSLNLGDSVRFNEMKSTLLPLYGKTGSKIDYILLYYSLNI